MPEGLEDLEARIRRGYEAMGRRDFDSALDGVDPDVEWHDPPEFPDRRPPLRGRDAIKQVWEEYFEAFGDISFEPREIAQSGDRVFLELRIVASGKSSGAPVDMTWYQVGTVDADGATHRLENYLDRDRALRAAGLA